MHEYQHVTGPDVSWRLIKSLGSLGVKFVQCEVLASRRAKFAEALRFVGEEMVRVRSAQSKFFCFFFKKGVIGISEFLSRPTADCRLSKERELQDGIYPHIQHKGRLAGYEGSMYC